MGACAGGAVEVMLLSESSHSRRDWWWLGSVGASRELRASTFFAVYLNDKYSASSATGCNILRYITSINQSIAYLCILTAPCDEGLYEMDHFMGLNDIALITNILWAQVPLAGLDTVCLVRRCDDMVAPNGQ
jgi:hypothetical protein